MKKIFTTVVALLVMGSFSFAQDAAKTTTTKKTTKTKTEAPAKESKMDAKADAKPKEAKGKEGAAK